MILSEIALPDWDALISHPLQSTGYAAAARALGYRPFFAADRQGRALVLVRRVPVPVLSSWTAHAKVYADVGDATFVPLLVDRLRKLGVSHVKLGDSLWPWTGPSFEVCEGMRPIVYHLFVHDLRGGEQEVLSRAHRMIRRHIRKAAEEVTVSPVRTPADLRDYLRLVAETGERMRVRDVAAVYPAAYFETIVRRMVPRRQALMVIARAGTRPLAGSTFVTTGDRFAHIHGCSTRDRALTPKQGPTAVFWHAMREAMVRGCRLFDMGAVTPTEDPQHPHASVFEYKRLWGGRLEEFRSAELIVSAWKHRVQTSLLAPLWDRLHPLYLRLFSDGRWPAVGALDFTELEPRP
jgi:GNAT acetyltransferase-like protein